MHSASDVAAAWSPTSTILSSRITAQSNDESMRASASALSPLQSQRFKAMRQCIGSAKDKFDGWQRATARHKSASSNVSTASLPDRYFKVTNYFAPRPYARPYLQHISLLDVPATWRRSAKARTNEPRCGDWIAWILALRPRDIQHRLRYLR